MKKQSLDECILEAIEVFSKDLFPIKVGPGINYIVLSRYMTGWIKQAIKNGTVEIGVEDGKMP